MVARADLASDSEIAALTSASCTITSRTWMAADRAVEYASVVILRVELPFAPLSGGVWNVWTSNGTPSKDSVLVVEPG